MRSAKIIWLGILLILIILGIVVIKILFRASSTSTSTSTSTSLVPDIKTLPPSPDNDLIRYGRELIANTSKYFGPSGIISHTTNGLNCQNCHLDAGSRPYSNNFLGVASTYPMYRPRSGKIESIEFRVNECLERSLCGKMIDSMSKEMRAMVAYIKWIGSKVEKGSKNDAAGAMVMPYIERAADPVKGAVIYGPRCSSCHGHNGEGVWSADSNVYRYPPLWGDNAYAVSAGMYRVGKLAGFIRNNMPVGASKQSPFLTNEECWDVAAYINSKPHPMKMFAYDWPDISKKPVDYPFRPYTDTFSEVRHKYGPYGSLGH